MYEIVLLFPTQFIFLSKAINNILHIRSVSFNYSVLSEHLSNREHVHHTTMEKA